MAVSPRIIRRRIRSVTNTKKITKAMELVAASKMRRAVSSVLATRPYAEAAWRAIKELAKVTDPTLHPLLKEKKDSTKALVILFSSDRGLCGGFNAQMAKTLVEFLKSAGGAIEIDFVVVGKKGHAMVSRMTRQIVASFTDLSNNPRVTDIRTIADIAIHDFTHDDYGRVYLAFTDYRSALTQKPVIRQLLPIVRIEGLGDVSAALKGAAPDHNPDHKKNGKSMGQDLDLSPGTYEYVFEPSPRLVLDAMLPRLVESQIYQALLESSASEHSARMMAMRSATDAAGDMIDGLTLAYNQARQAGITREIAEISSGKAALE